MAEVILRGLEMKRESKSFTDSLYAVLTGAGLFSGPKYRLSALSGMAFIFSVHERLLPLSVTAYGEWGTVHKRAADSLGIFTVTDAGRTRHPTFKKYQQDAVKWIKSSLDRGLGAVYWLPEFGVIHGYDDADRIFYVQDGYSAESKIVLYDNFGINFTPFWYAQMFGGKVDIGEKDMVLEALRMALDDWETPHPVPPNRSIASGRKAYSYFIHALEQGDFDSFGAVYVWDAFRGSRTEIMFFFAGGGAHVSGIAGSGGMLRAACGHDGTAGALDRFRERGPNAQPGEHSGLIGVLKETEKLEERAMGVFRSISVQYPDLKRSTVPRWGLHTAR
ncbi:hypothetical protein CM49_00864 [Paenibacillus sp. P1XP2]|nr:hypothetical protein CM49_00864 [Paenibacillus sp. P1XP2]